MRIIDLSGELLPRWSRPLTVLCALGLLGVIGLPGCGTEPNPDHLGGARGARLGSSAILVRSPTTATRPTTVIRPSRANTAASPEITTRTLVLQMALRRWIMKTTPLQEAWPGIWARLAVPGTPLLPTRTVAPRTAPNRANTAVARTAVARRAVATTAAVAHLASARSA